MYKDNGLKIAKSQRKSINDKVLYIIENGVAGRYGISKEDIFNLYTGNGGLHGLEYNDFKNYQEFKEAKKEIEQGQFFTPHSLCSFVINCIRPTEQDIVMDLTCGSGNFINSLPVQSNFYGCEIDTAAAKIASYLYPGAHITCDDVHYYDPGIMADIVIGNPPYHLEFFFGEKDGEKAPVPSQTYYCLRAAQLLKPGGLFAIIVPESFMSDEIFQKTEIESITGKYDFLVQVKLPPNSFKQFGAANFATKLMLFRRKSKHLPKRAYSLEILSPKKLDNGLSQTIHEKYVCPAIQEKQKVKSKIFYEIIQESDDRVSSSAQEKITKLLYDIRRNPKTAQFIGQCENYVREFYTQKPPMNMAHYEWDKIKIKEADVFRYLKRVLNYQNSPLSNVVKLVKNKYGFYYKDYGEMLPRKRQYVSINDLVLQNRTLKGYKKLLRKKRKAYERQNALFLEMPHGYR